MKPITKLQSCLRRCLRELHQLGDSRSHHLWGGGYSPASHRWLLVGHLSLRALAVEQFQHRLIGGCTFAPELRVPEPVRLRAPELPVPEPVSLRAPELPVPEPVSLRVPELRVPEPVRLRAPELPVPEPVFPGAGRLPAAADAPKIPRCGQAARSSDCTQDSQLEGFKAVRAGCSSERTQDF